MSDRDISKAEKVSRQHREAGRDSVTAGTPSVAGSSDAHKLDGIPTLEPRSALPVDTGDWTGVELSSGRYRVVERLGEGGMGVVYRAEDRTLSDEAVIKRPHRHLVADAGAVARFLSEIRSLILLPHPHICHVRDAGEHADVPFVVMNYLRGGSVADRITRYQPGRVPADLFEWLPQIAKALDFVHRERHVHRDVKPSNILFDQHGNAYLADFGMAKALSQDSGAPRGHSLTLAGTFIGTPEYTAPEVFMGEPYGSRADQYALAAVVYELLCGQPPFEGLTPFAISVRQATTEPRSPRKLNASVSEEASRAVLRGLSKDPAARFDTCMEFVQRLNGASISPRASGRWFPTLFQVGSSMKEDTANPQDEVNDIAQSAAVSEIDAGETRGLDQPDTGIRRVWLPFGGIFPPVMKTVRFLTGNQTAHFGGICPPVGSPTKDDAVASQEETKDVDQSVALSEIETAATRGLNHPDKGTRWVWLSLGGILTGLILAYGIAWYTDETRDPWRNAPRIDSYAPYVDSDSAVTTPTEDFPVPDLGPLQEAEPRIFRQSGQ